MKKEKKQEWQRQVVHFGLVLKEVDQGSLFERWQYPLMVRIAAYANGYGSGHYVAWTPIKISKEMCCAVLAYACKQAAKLVLRKKGQDLRAAQRFFMHCAHIKNFKKEQTRLLRGAATHAKRCIPVMSGVDTAIVRLLTDDNTYAEAASCILYYLQQEVCTTARKQSDTARYFMSDCARYVAHDLMKSRLTVPFFYPKNWYKNVDRLSGIERANAYYSGEARMLCPGTAEGDALKQLKQDRIPWHAVCLTHLDTAQLAHGDWRVQRVLPVSRKTKNKKGAV